MPKATDPPEHVTPTLQGFRGRVLERRLLLWTLPLFALASAALAASQPSPQEAIGGAALLLGTIWGGCFALHLFLCAIRFDGDAVVLPLYCALLGVGSAYHAEPRRLTESGLALGGYHQAALVGLVILAAVTAVGRNVQRINHWIEERIWWKVAGDQPYYASIPFHFLLLGLMLVLVALLAVGGIRGEGGALIQVPLPGGFSFTPSEFIRLAVAFFLADHLGRNSRALRSLRQPLGRTWPLNRILIEPKVELTVVLAICGLYLVFFYVFRDFGPAAIIIGLTLLALLAATGRILTPLCIGLLIAAGVAIPTWHHLAFSTLARRFEMWLNPWDVHFVNGDHQARILWAIASGGWFGTGVGVVPLAQLLPLARNDAAFAGIAGAMGLWVGLAVLALFAGLTWRGMIAARQAPTDRTRLLAFCLTSLLALQAVWISGAMVRVFPFTGINLPFISTGLTSMIASTLALGALWNVSRLRTGRRDASEASPEVQRTIGRLGRPMVWLFALPAVGLLLYGCPWLLGDRTLTQPVMALDRHRERMQFDNPFLERFRRTFARGRIFSADNELLAETVGARDDWEPGSSPRLPRRPEGNRAIGGRRYPAGESTALLVGWTPEGKFAGQTDSVEMAADSLLRGYRPSQLPFYYRVRNNPLVPRPVPQDVQLTVRLDLQRFAAQRLARGVRGAGGAGGAAVVFDATTGEILTAANVPTFDPNTLSLERMRELVAQNPRTQVLTNKALARGPLLFPGSAFKILTAAAAYEAEPGGAVTCRNGRNAEPITWESGGKRWRRPPGRTSDYTRGGHGAMRLEHDLESALAVSCNVFFGRLAAELGADRLHHAMQAAEFRSVPSEAVLAEHLPENGFGQVGVKTSPIELAMLAAAAGVAGANTPDAAASRPHWIRAIARKDGGTVKLRDPEGITGAPDRRPYRPFGAKPAQRLREAMVGVVERPEGTAHAAFFTPAAQKRLAGITVGGKTGTAEFEKRVPGRRRPGIGRHAWFVGFARSDHEPQPRTVAFAVVVEDVRRGGTGGTVCAPIARDLIAQILPVAGAPPRGDFQDLDRFFRERLRPNLGPLAPLADFLRKILGRR
jgi:cell division protein FtsI/penicillin-binding protein 2/cell division protein FtsW (lipid II flippase)